MTVGGLVWTHMELARALYLLDAARLRRRYGTVGLAAWRLRAWRVAAVAETFEANNDQPAAPIIY